MVTGTVLGFEKILWENPTVLDKSGYCFFCNFLSVFCIAYYLCYTVKSHCLVLLFLK